jgi:hypothetical protein
MVDARTRATEQILAHVDRARDMIQDFRKDCIDGEEACAIHSSEAQPFARLAMS